MIAPLSSSSAHNTPAIFRALLATLLTLLAPTISRAQTPSTPLQDTTISPHIHSAYIAPTGWDIAPPIITLNGNETLTLTFDYLGETPPAYTYRLLHCDRRWNSSELPPSTYLNGYETNALPHPRTSMATQQTYYHYHLQIPNHDTQPTLSGNYILQVLDPDDEHIVLQKRFALVEPLIPILAKITQVTGAKSRTHQRIEAQLDYSPLGQFIAPRDLHLLVRQNWYGSCTQELNLAGYTGTTTLRYGRIGQGMFPGANEWRTLDLQQLYGNHQNYQDVRNADGEFHVQLYTDKPLSPIHHLTHQEDLNGYPAIGYTGDWRTLYAQGSSSKHSPLESDYAWVYFSLTNQLTHLNDTIYLQIGGLYDNPGIPMRYSHERHQYEASLRLKQGVYSYRYLLADDLTPTCNHPYATEACFSTTENTYNLLLYYRPPAATYDRLIGHTLISTHP